MSIPTSTVLPGAADLPRQPRKKYVPAVGPRLKKLLLFVLALIAVLTANSAYLAAITFLNWWTGHEYQNYFYQHMVLWHLILGLVLILPFVAFGLIHMVNAWNRKNRRAVRVGYALLVASIAVLVSGLLLMRFRVPLTQLEIALKQPLTRDVIYWLHVGLPLGAAWLYWLHRLTGPRIKWRIGLTYLGVVGAAVLAMVLLHSQDPRQWNVAGPQEGEKYFRPSLARTATGNFIPPQTLMMDSYCLKCHEDAYQGWFHSAHHFSSFNNPPYLAAVSETREVALKRDGDVKASRWCAGCHDPVPFLSGAFDDPNYDIVKDPTSQAGITCTACHAITNVNSTVGNGDYTIEEPIHYPFAFSENPVLQYVNELLVKGKPSFHKKTFLKKDVHTKAEFCSVCHKVNLPKDVTHYKDFLRGQNHYDPFVLSGASGHGARSFYYPPKPFANCAGCHMPVTASNDFGAQLFGTNKLSIHDHFFPSANTGITWLNDAPEFVARHREFLAGRLRIDIFGLKAGADIASPLIGPIRPKLPTLKPGQEYLLETVIRTLKMGHLFTQGTVDSNEVWVDVTVKSGDRVIGRSGSLDEKNEVDRWSHFVNVFMLDKDGNRINRRNAQDIFTPLYNHQIPPGAAQVVHYRLVLPPDITQPVTIDVKLQYRKFDQEYMQFVAQRARKLEKPLRGDDGEGVYDNPLPITTLCADQVTLAVEGGAPLPASDGPPPPAKDEFPFWQRWNDYGIGLLLEGTASGQAKGELRQAAAAFAEVEKLGRYDGPLNLARALFFEGRLDEAMAAANRAAGMTPPPPPWVLAWLAGQVNRQQGNLPEAAENLRSIVKNTVVSREQRQMGYDFSLDYEVLNLLGVIYFDLAKQIRGDEDRAEREALLRQAVATFQQTLAIDSENVEAHYNLQLLYAQLGDDERAAEHLAAHARYKPDDNARDRAFKLAREKYPWADRAAESLVIYDLQRAAAAEPPATAGNESNPKVLSNLEVVRE